MKPVSRGIDRVAVMFDDPNLVANAGLLLVATVVKKLHLEDLIDSRVNMAGRTGGFKPGRKVLTLVHAMVAGASHIDHADMLRAGSTAKVLDHRVMAPSTVGTFLRAFTFGRVRQLEAAIGDTLTRAWQMGAGPGESDLTIDVDSSIHEVHGKLKAGAAYGYTKVLGYHPIYATRAKTGEVLHARMRKGSANTQRGTKRFVEELIARVRRAGATGKITMRFDSGYWSEATLGVLEKKGVSYTMAVRGRNKAIAKAIAQIPDEGWVAIYYTDDGEAEVAETTYKGRRLVIRRTRLTGNQATLWPDWRHFGFLTDLPGPATEVDAFHRERALTELDIRDLKEGAGMEHCPSGNFSANAAWMCCAVIAHDLIRWTAHLGRLIPDDESRAVARTLRTRYFAVPARLVNHSGRPTLRGPLAWPWRSKFLGALSNLRSIAFAPT